MKMEDPVWRSRLRSRWRSLSTDWRARTVAAAALVASLATASAYWLFFDVVTRTDHVGSIFASWVAGVALFVLLGLVAAIVTLARPEDESPERRARILFRMQSGRHIDYILTKIGSSFEPYVEKNSKRIIVHEHIAPAKKFRVSSETKTVVRGYIDDLPATYASSIQYKNASPPPAGKSDSRLNYFRIDGAPAGPPETFSIGLDRKFTAKIPPYGSCAVHYHLEYWIEADNEPNRFTATRYTLAHELDMENHLEETIKVTVFPKDRDAYDVLIKPGESRSIVKLADFAPEEHLYDYRLTTV
jgi:hypothetical protein